MKKLSKIALVICGTALSISTANASHNSTTFLGPSLQGTYTSTITDETAYSINGEAGIKNLRAGGTFGINLACNQRIKVSGEYLAQRINYNYWSGNRSNQWMGQGTVGSGYQYDFGNTRFNPQFDLNAYVSTAPSKSFNERTVTVIDPLTDITTITTYNRRIAGSHSYNISPGIAFQPWCGSKAGFEFNYDNVRYLTRHLNTRKQDPKGWGGTARLNQYVAKNIEVGVLAAVRQPFNNYRASVAWNRDTHIGVWALGVDGNYVAGKHRLPNTYNVGLTADVFIDRLCEPCKEAKAFTQHFLGWTSDTSAHMPQVLAVGNQRITSTTVATVLIPN